MQVKPVKWNEEKNQLLIIQRKLSFEMVLEKMENQEILARKSHPDTKRYPHQFIFVLELEGYICYVPFVENDDEIFLKTIIPSRKLKKEFEGKSNEKK
jgi:hypothetical protein